MKMASVCTAILLVFCLATVQAANETKPASPVVGTCVVNGRTVILNGDGTWEYFQEISPSIGQTNDDQKGTLSFDASVGSTSGDLKPIAGGTFYLLNDDLLNILQTSGLKPEKRLSLLDTFSMANYGSSLGIERNSKVFVKAMESVKPHVVATTTSDSNGKGKFSSIVPGTYYLMNVSVVYLNTGSLIDRSALLWNLKVEIKSGQNSITLDQENAVP